MGSYEKDMNSINRAAFLNTNPVTYLRPFSYVAIVSNIIFMPTDG